MDSWWSHNSKNKLLSKMEPVSDERARKIQEDLIEEKEEMKHHVRMLEYDYIEKPTNAEDMELVSNVKQNEEDDQNGDEDSNYQKDYENGGDDLVDPQAELKSECQTSHCSELMDELIECNKRVNGKRQTLETCEQELYDMIHCVDHCVSKTLFSRLKLHNRNSKDNTQMEGEQQLMMLFETNATLETQKFNNSNKRQALVEEQNRETRLLSLNSKLYHTTELMNTSKQDEITKYSAPLCDLNKSRYAANDLPNNKKSKKSQKDNCFSTKNNIERKQGSKIEKERKELPTKARDESQELLDTTNKSSQLEKNELSTKSEDESQALCDSKVSGRSVLKSDTRSSTISSSSPLSKSRSSYTFPRSPLDSEDKGSQTADHDELMHYWNCDNCSNSGQSNRSSNLPAMKGGGFGFMGTAMDYQVSDKEKIEVDICPPLEIIQPTFNDFYEIDPDWLEESAQCPYEDLLVEEEVLEEEEEEYESIASVDPCENMQSMTEWERCLAGCCQEACDENASQVSYDYQCDEEFTACNDDDCEI